MKTVFKNFDYVLFFASLLACVIGLAAIQSAESNTLMPIADIVKKQMYFIAAGAAIALVIAFFDYENIKGSVGIIVGMAVVLLVLVLIMGTHSKGAQRWLSIGGIIFQPSEIAKIVVILAVAKILSGINIFRKLDKGSVISIILTVFLPWVLILVQPDLGTSLVLVFTTAFMLFTAGVKFRYLFGTGILGALVLSFVLKDYQRDRILVFLDKTKDPTGIGWNINQAEIAIGHGGISGQGWFLGTQTQLSFVPEHETDFIFSVIGEEFGFIGCLLLMVLYVVIMLRCICIIKNAKDNFGMFTAVGIFAFMSFHIFVNMGMVLGIMPVVGVPLTFVSYGGTAIITNFIAIGILESIYVRRERLLL